MSELNAEACRSVVELLIEKMNARYIFSEQAAAFESHMRDKLAAGRYQHFDDMNALARALTDDLRQVTNDKHLRVEYDPVGYERMTQAALAEKTDDEEEIDPRYLEYGRKTNYGFERVERLQGNIGYIRLNGFFVATFGGDTAIAAMNFVANTRALIFDLRYNGGGSPSMVQLLTAYLFEAPKHLNSFYARYNDTTEQFWTPAWVPGKRLAKTPVFVLTSRRTFSGAEEFTYNLKHMKRATIIGETTGGGAHPVTPQPLADGLIVALCEARAVNPITKSNWEGTGIEPDIAVHEDDALKKAHVLALETLRDKATSDEDKSELEWQVTGVRAFYDPPKLSTTALDRCTGNFRQFKFERKDDRLIFTADGFWTGWLAPISDTLFADGRFEYMRYEFTGGNGSQAAELRLIRHGEPEPIVIPRNPA